MDTTQVWKLTLGLAALIAFLGVQVFVSSEQRANAFAALAVHMVPVTFIPRGEVTAGRVVTDALAKILTAACLYLTLGEWLEARIARADDFAGIIIVGISAIVWAYSMYLLGVAHLELLLQPQRPEQVPGETPANPREHKVGPDEQEHKNDHGA